ncbi:family with sequence similarity 173, member b [Plakobranchus ocellatus]|uniref:Family with sequence similarity 173, member b n=1 Tax=Plakobranchus ocellatus TaxID=259542 RepID=A0AAV3Z0T8_9GAST|nr:family with sequence similarity 173, member b [Plakobranchus ocellatus]
MSKTPLASDDPANVNYRPNIQEDCDFCQQISEAGKSSKPPQLSQRGAVMLGIVGAVFTGISAALVPFVMPGLRRVALPYIPASAAQISYVFRALEGRSGSLLDIGSGDGRITMAAARQGFQGHGVELNIWLVLYSRWRAWAQGLSRHAKFYKRDLWKTNLSSYQNIVIFGVESMMAPLEVKMGQELNPGTNIVACRFPLPSWSPVTKLGDGVDTVWLYIIPDSVIGHSQVTS